MSLRNHSMTIPSKNQSISEKKKIVENFSSTKINISITISNVKDWSKIIEFLSKREMLGKEMKQKLIIIILCDIGQISTEISTRSHNNVQQRNQ